MRRIPLSPGFAAPRWLSAAWATALYVAAAALWILVSDELLVGLVHDAALIEAIRARDWSLYG